MASASINETNFATVRLSMPYPITDLSTDIDGNVPSITAPTHVLLSGDINNGNQNAGNQSTDDAYTEFWNC